MGNVVQGNYIGTDVTGFVNVGSDDLEGVMIDDSPTNLIGGSVPGAGNLITTNFNNIEISGAASIGNLIQGNLIGDRCHRHSRARFLLDRASSLSVVGYGDRGARRVRQGDRLQRGRAAVWRSRAEARATVFSELHFRE